VGNHHPALAANLQHLFLYQEAQRLFRLSWIYSYASALDSDFNLFNRLFGLLSSANRSRKGVA
jgi:hypothetical protein